MKNLSSPTETEMRELVASLTPAERSTLKDPNFINEDEADLIMHDRAIKESGWITLDQLLKENGQTRRKRIA